MTVTKRKISRTNQRAPTPGKKDSTKNAVARKTKKPTVRTARLATATAAAAPLLATSPKKMGPVLAEVMNAVNPSAFNPFALHDFDPLALAQPWMRLCVQVAVANFALQAHMARTAMYLPQAAAARALR